MAPHGMALDVSDMRTMPGLVGKSAAISIDLDENGEIVGLY